MADTALASPSYRDRRWLKRLAALEPFYILLMGWPLLLPQRFTPEALQPLIETWRPALLAALLVFWPIRLLAYRRLSIRTPIDWPLVFMLLWLPVNYWASADKALSWGALTYPLYGIALYTALINWPPAQRHPQWTAGLIILIGAGLAAIAPAFSNLSFGKLFNLPALEALNRQLSALVPGNVNANQVGGALVVVVPVALAMTLRGDWSRRRWPRLLVALLTLFMLGMLLLTQSRGAYLAALIALPVVVVLRWPRLRYLLMAAVAMGVIALFAIGPERVVEAVLGGSSASGLSGRLEVWSRALYALSDFPFTGIGIGTFNRVIPVLYPFFTIAPDAKLDHAHNLFLQVGLDLGLPGLIAYIALWLVVLAVLIVALRRRAPIDGTLAAGTLGGVIAMLVHGIVDVPVWGGKTAFIPWLLIALAMQLAARSASPQPADSDTAPST